MNAGDGRAITLGYRAKQPFWVRTKWPASVPLGSRNILYSRCGMIKTDVSDMKLQVLGNEVPAV